MNKRYDFPVPFGWYGVSLSRELAAGEVKPLQYFGKELVLFRTESGEARLLDAFCPHLGAHLGHGGKVKGEHIACPFHGWEFSGEGVCQHIPYAQNMPPRADGNAEHQADRFCRRYLEARRQDGGRDQRHRARR